MIGIAIKDRGAILPAGHNANAAYWFDGETGAWMSSTYYMKTLPGWVNDFNKLELPKKYCSQMWTTLLPIDRYTESTTDDTKYEGKFSGETAPVFPHDLPKLMAANSGLGIIRNSPFGNSLTKDFAIQTIKSENLGKGNFTDMLTLSFSSTDYVGHMYGPQSIEVEDTYLRLDKDLGELLKFLDAWVGKTNVLIFLTADHGAVENPSYLSDMGIPAGNINSGKFVDSLKRSFTKKYGDSLILAYENQEFYLDHAVISKKKLDLSEIENTITNYVLTIKGVSGTINTASFSNSNCPPDVTLKVRNGHLTKRSGDLYVHYEPSWIEFGSTGTTHGSPYPYDTHVPLLWYGWNVKPGSTSSPVEITDIVPTLSQLLDVQVPDGCTGKPIPNLIK